MGFKQAYKEVMMEYEKDRINSAILLQKKNQEIYDKYPEIKEIDEQLTAAGLNLSKQILKDVSTSVSRDNTSVLDDFKIKISSLRDKKLQILSENGYDDEYFAGVYKCDVCKDTGYIQNKKCSCLVQKLVEKYYDIANVCKIIKKENFDMFDFRYYSKEIDPSTGVSPYNNMQMIYTNCIAFVKEFPTNFQNLLFYGDTGLGKTFLCNCIAKDMLDTSATVLYVTAPQIFKKIEDYRFNRDEMDEADDQISMIYNVDLLIIDDLGSEFSTVVTNTELFNIINSRILESKHTIISTNLSLNDFQSQYSDRIVSRLFGNYKMMRFFGDDIRVKKKLGAGF